MDPIQVEDDSCRDPGQRTRIGQSGIFPGRRNLCALASVRRDPTVNVTASAPMARRRYEVGESKRVVVARIATIICSRGSVMRLSR